jgi:hypothetical protein
MGLLPLAHTLGILGVPEIILVFRFGQPRALALALTGFATVGFAAEALALSVATIGKKKLLAMLAVTSAVWGFHRFPNQGNQNQTFVPQSREEKTGRRRPITAKKEEDSLANRSKKNHRKKIQFLIARFVPVRFCPWD